MSFSSVFVYTVQFGQETMMKNSASFINLIEFPATYISNKIKLKPEWFEITLL